MGYSNNETTFKLKNIGAYKNVVRLLFILWKEHPFFATLLCLTTTILGIIPALELWVTGRLVDQFSSLFSNSDLSLTPVVINGLILIALMIGHNWIRIFSETIQDYLRDKVAGELQQEILEKSYNIELSFFRT